MRLPAVRCRSQLARRTMVLHRSIEAARRCGTLLISRRPIATSAERRARTPSSSVLPPTERPPAQWRLFACHANAGCALEVTDCTSHHGLAPRKEPARRCSSLSWCVVQSRSARHGAHTRQARDFRHQPEDSQRSDARARATRMPGARWRSQLARRTTVLRRKREALLLAEYLSIERRPTTTSAARRARAASSRVLPPPERPSAQWRSFAYHASAGCAF